MNSVEELKHFAVGTPVPLEVPTDIHIYSEKFLTVRDAVDIVVAPVVEQAYKDLGPVPTDIYPDGLPSSEDLDNIEIEKNPIQSSEHLTTSAALVSQLLKSQTILDALDRQGLKPDKFEVFQLQVIAAFKHLGLDTKKFFPE